MNSGEHPSSRSQDKKRREDIAFLEKVKSADMDELLKLYTDHQHASAPRWKKAAITRAIRKRSTCADVLA